MSTRQFEQTAVFEHSFWLQVLGDHSRFIFYALPASERAYWQQAELYIQQFDQLLQSARTSLNDPSRLHEITRSAYQQATQFREFKLFLLRRQLTGTIHFHLSPAFVNHMVNELDEYIRILGFLLRQQVPPPAPAVHHHLLWLLDATGHAGSIEAELDLPEHHLKMKSHKFMTDFQHFYMKALEMAGFLRTNLDRFPALARFNREVKLEMVVFQEFLKELEEMELKKEDLSTFSPLMADHMYREECYYLMKLAEVSELSPPDCNPAKPRVEADQIKN